MPGRLARCAFEDARQRTVAALVGIARGGAFVTPFVEVVMRASGGWYRTSP
jgi:hypothetical protein